MSAPAGDRRDRARPAGDPQSRDRPMTEDEIGAYVDATALALGLPLAPAHRPGVIRYFGLAASFAALLDAVPLARDDDVAPVFTPIAPSAKPPRMP